LRKKGKKKNPEKIANRASTERGREKNERQAVELVERQEKKGLRTKGPQGGMARA